MKLVKSLMKQGVDKGEIFAKAIDSGLDPKKVSRYLSHFPDKSLSEKYHKVNIILLIAYGALILAGIWLALRLGMSSELSPKVWLVIMGVVLIIPLTLMYLIYRKYAESYILFILFQINGVDDAFEGYEQDPVTSWITLFIILGVIIFVINLKKRLFPYQNFFNTKKTDYGIYIFSQNVADEAAKKIR